MSLETSREEGPGLTALPSTLGAVRIPHAIAWGTGLALAAWLLLVTWSRNLCFFFDDWSFLLHARDWTLGSYFLPCNQHWTTLPMVIFQGLVHAFGLRTPVPYLAVVMLGHAATAWLMFVLIRRRSGDLLALIAMGVFLFLARGARDFTWAFQITFVGSLFFGLLAMWLLQRAQRPWPWVAGASVALLFSLMCSGQGVFLALALATELMVDRERRPYLAAFVPPFALYATWFATFGMMDHRSDASSLRLGLHYLPVQVPDGIGSALAALAGLPHELFVAPLVLACAGLALHYLRRGITPATWGMLVGLLGLYAGITLTRYAAADPWTSRYAYVGAMYWLFLLTDAARDLPWKGAWRPLWGLLGAGLVGINLYGVHYFINHKNLPFVTMQRTALQTIEAVHDAPGADLDGKLMEASDQVLDAPVVVLPFTARQYLKETQALGSPVSPVTRSQLVSLPAAGVDHALRLLFGHQLTQTATLSALPAGSGDSLDSTSPPLDLDLAPGERLILHAPAHARVQLALGWREPPQSPTASLSLSAVAVAIRMPDPGLPLRWHLRVTVPDGTVRVVRPDPRLAIAR